MTYSRVAVTSLWLKLFLSLHEYGSWQVLHSLDETLIISFHLLTVCVCVYVCVCTHTAECEAKDLQHFPMKPSEVRPTFTLFDLIVICSASVYHTPLLHGVRSTYLLTGSAPLCTYGPNSLIPMYDLFTWAKWRLARYLWHLIMPASKKRGFKLQCSICAAIIELQHAACQQVFAKFLRNM